MEIGIFDISSYDIQHIYSHHISKCIVKEIIQKAFQEKYQEYLQYKSNQHATQFIENTTNSCVNLATNLGDNNNNKIQNQSQLHCLLKKAIIKSSKKSQQQRTGNQTLHYRVGKNRKNINSQIFSKASLMNKQHDTSCGVGMISLNEYYCSEQNEKQNVNRDDFFRQILNIKTQKSKLLNCKSDMEKKLPQFLEINEKTKQVYFTTQYDGQVIVFRNKAKLVNPTYVRKQSQQRKFTQCRTTRFKEKDQIPKPQVINTKFKLKITNKQAISRQKRTSRTININKLTCLPLKRQVSNHPLTMLPINRNVNFKNEQDEQRPNKARCHADLDPTCKRCLKNFQTFQLQIRQTNKLDTHLANHLKMLQLQQGVTFTDVPGKNQPQKQNIHWKGSCKKRMKRFTVNISNNKQKHRQSEDENIFKSLNISPFRDKQKNRTETWFER